jgi:uncharacterized protein involved in outer membrane biogenesis
MRKIRLILAALLVFIVGIGLTKNFIAKAALSAGVKAMTGLGLQIRSLRVGILRPVLEVRDLKLLNPSGFRDGIMVDLPEMYTDYDLGAFLQKKVHLRELRLNLKEFTVIKNEKGQLNLDSLKTVQAGKQAKTAPKKQEKAPEIRIDSFALRIGKVIYKDYSSGKPVVHEFKINLDEHYQDITNPGALASIILVKALANTTISSLANFDIGPLEQEVSQALKKAGKLVVDTAKKTEEKAKETAKELGKTATDTVKKTGEEVKKLLPFGK